jgi:hypothetical protein
VDLRVQGEPRKLRGARGNLIVEKMILQRGVVVER